MEKRKGFTCAELSAEAMKRIFEYDSAVNYDHPIIEVEKDNKKILQYELIGLGREHIKVEKEFINKTKRTFLNVTGKYIDAQTGFENEINIHLQIDTATYDNYTHAIKNGILTITLYEIINEVPKFEER